MASFDEDEIGSKMTTNYISIQTGLTVKQAMSALIQQASENDNISTLFVSDQSGVFCGAIDLEGTDHCPARHGIFLADHDLLPIRLWP